MRTYLSNFIVAVLLGTMLSAESEFKIEGEVWAQGVQACITSVDDVSFELSYREDDYFVFDNMTFREAMFGSLCPGILTLQAMLPDVPKHELENYCLVYNKKRKTYLGYANGNYDAFRRCKDALDFEKSSIVEEASFVFPDRIDGRNVDLQRCTAQISGVNYRLSFDWKDDDLFENMTKREVFFGGDCPGETILQAMLPDLTRSERSLFCLSFDKEEKQYVGFARGERDAYVRCKKPSKSVCERVNGTKEGLIAVAGVGAGATAGASAAASAAGVTAVSHSSGAVILTGSSGYIAGTLGSLGSGALAVLTAPATLTAAAVTVVGVGGAVLV